MHMYFISGASGVGKTTTMELLKTELPLPYIVKDFDERGVPKMAGRSWRLAETAYWISEGKRATEEGKVLIVCGLANPEEISVMPEASEIEVRIILLDADEMVVEERLRSRNQDKGMRDGLKEAVGSVEDFIAGNTEFVKMLREISIHAGVPVIDTTNLTPEGVIVEVKKLLEV